MEPRIYTYKITFEEIPHWYWGAHKEEKYDDGYLGSPSTHAWKWEFYTPQLQICEVFPYTDEGWAEARKVEDRCILPDLNNPLCLNEHVGGLMSLEASKEGGRTAGKKFHQEKDENGKSVRGQEIARLAHLAKDGNGKSITAVKAGTSNAREKDENGKSVNPRKAGKAAHLEKDEAGVSVHFKNTIGAIHDERDESGRSVHAMRSLHQKYMCLETGKILSPGPLTLWQRHRGIDTSLRVKVDNKGNPNE
jgi:hypothetical protein